MPERESWLFRVELPAGVENGDRLMALLLKHLRRVWGVKATAILDAPPDAPAHSVAVRSAGDEKEG